jgi:hypothetical protein
MKESKGKKQAVRLHTMRPLDEAICSRRLGRVYGNSYGITTTAFMISELRSLRILQNLPSNVFEAEDQGPCNFMPYSDPRQGLTTNHGLDSEAMNHLHFGKFGIGIEESDHVDSNPV